MNNPNQIIIYNTDDGKAKVSLYAQDGTVWLNQNQLAELFDTSVSNINKHIANILDEKELNKNSVIEYFSITATDGKNYQVAFYSLPMILAIGFRVRSRRGVQFRQWANGQLTELMQKGFVMDDERLKNPDGRPDYFDELLARIRDIRASEKRFYQKVRDLLALSSDYDPSDKATQMFFAETQNKLIYAITHQTAAELVVSRANHQASNMGLTHWQGNIVRKQDIFTAKNYLTADEIDQLNRLTVIFLESAELRVKTRQDLTLAYWRSNVDALLAFNDQPILANKGKINHQQMEQKVRLEYEQFDQWRKQMEAKQADNQELEMLTQLAKVVKNREKEE
ncbi:virulence RhuM family protein [Gallibacterium melopsittaci]|uniref:Virulence RhuM family protein n=1 Tax=Gallibacterium melopsittaci TaxID=516063 RepID=A0ABV6HUS8_9PAST